MSFAPRARRPLAIGLALLLTAGSLALSAPLSAAAASNSSQAASVQSGLNTLRTKAGLPKLVNNGYVKRYVQRYTEVFAKSGATAANNDTKYSLPEGYTVVTGPGITLTNYSDSKAVKAIIDRAKSAILSTTSGAATRNYASVGYYKKNSTTKVAFVITMNYATAPADLMTLSTPSISGSVRLGQTLKAKVATSPAASSYAYQWKIGDEVIGEASSLKITDAARVGKKITLTVTATRSGYTTVTKTTKASTLGKGKFTTKSVKVSGKRARGSVLTAATPTWSSVATYSYQWLRNGKTIKGATGQTYKQAYADKKKKIDVKVKASAPGYNSATKTSKTTTKTK